MRSSGVSALIVLLAGSGVAVAEDDGPAGAAHVAAVRSLIADVAAGEREAFESRFGRVRGMQPDELWQGAHVLIGRFGAIEEVSLGSVDGESGGVYVAVKFANAQREVFVRLDDDGLIRQLMYVPPDVH